jgi:threonylcarbamoyladenosine tRNA methylthiotransferase MtaB
MKRRHTRRQALDAFARARRLRPDIALGADFIAGFPTETEDMFAQSLSLIEEAQLAYLHVFPYSARPGTPASRMRQVPGDVIRARAHRLREAGARLNAGFLAGQVGRRLSVLVENDGYGHAENHAPVRLQGARRGGIYAARIIDAGTDELVGETLGSPA